MIVDTLPHQYESFARQHSFCPWQTGLLGNMLSSQSANDKVLTINMGTQAGHTYFARIAASSDFPAKTKVYVTKQENLVEYANLLFNEDKVHEPIGLLDPNDFTGFRGNFIEFAIVDMSRESPKFFKDTLRLLCSSIPPTTCVILLQPGFF